MDANEKQYEQWRELRAKIDRLATTYLSECLDDEGYTEYLAKAAVRGAVDDVVKAWFSDNKKDIESRIHDIMVRERDNMVEKLTTDVIERLTTFWDI